MKWNRLLGACVAIALGVSGCSSSGSQVASGPATPVATTAPLVLPTASPAINDQETLQVATAAPVEAAPTATTEPSPVAEAEPATEAAPANTPVPTDSAPEVTDAATSVPAASPDVSADPAPPVDQAAPAESTPSAAAGTIDLGDFEVVNLITGANQNIAELAPSGPTMLWFWAPH